MIDIEKEENRVKTVYFERFGFKVYRDDLGGYMHRFICVLPNGHELRLHHILRSDAGTDLHDHPWDFWSFLLTGDYCEVRPSGLGDPLCYWPRFSLVCRKAEDLHRLMVAAPLWTIVWTGPRRRMWGFETGEGWVPYTKH